MNLRNIFKKKFNPNSFDGGLLARYPTKTKLIDTKIPDENGNTQMIMTEEGVLISDEKFSGVVYVNESTFEVFSGLKLEKIGVFKIGNKTNWDIETPRQIVNKAHLDFKRVLDERIKEIEPNCLCSYPRVTDYLQRNSTETYIISNVLRNKYLEYIDMNFDKETGIESHNYFCKICASNYLWCFQERGIDSLSMQIDKCSVKIGSEPEIQAPNFIDALTDKVYCNKSYLFRSNLFESDLNKTIIYLFQKK